MFYTLNKLKYNIQVRSLYYFYQTIITFKLLEKKTTTHQSLALSCRLLRFGMGVHNDTSLCENRNFKVTNNFRDCRKLYE